MSKTKVTDITTQKHIQGTNKVLFLQLVGKFRRFIKVNFFRNHVNTLLTKRTGECNRCGACCRIVFKCPFYFEQDGLGSCKIYGKHFTQCTFYPIEPKDLIGLEKDCDYSFTSNPN
ncbi:MAG: hypothetical protein Q8Q33_08595 [Chlamydiota bacterium]|nr:hypothetical protein [Chlamydiota bacterium]